MTQHTENELKPCPWCDSKPDIIEDDGKTMSGHYTAYVKCSLCENVIPHVGWGKTMKGAISETVSHWNTRHESEGLKELRQENERLAKQIQDLEGQRTTILERNEMLISNLNDVVKENERLREALEWYADSRSYEYIGNVKHAVTPVHLDMGFRAKGVLASTNNKTEDGKC